MADDKIELTFSCDACGADPATLTMDETKGDSAIVSCKACGQEFGTYGELQAKAMEMAKAEMMSLMKDAFKGFN